MSDNKTLSIVLPVHNEEKIINEVLNSIKVSALNYLDKIELIIVDNDCVDNTIPVIEKQLNGQQLKYEIIKNNSNNTAAGFNVGINNSIGNNIMIMGGHTLLDENYFSVLFSKFDRDNEWDCIGGSHKMAPVNLKERLIESVLNSPFGVGDSKFRFSKEPGYVDTVPYGTYKKEIFDKYGLLDETYVRNQDLEFNLRIKKRGAKIYYEPQLITYYKYMDKASILQFYKKYFLNGKWIGIKLFWKDGWQPRHLVPMVFILGMFFGIIASLFYPVFIYLVIGMIIFHLLVGLSFSFISGSGIQILFLPLIYLVFHLTYGLGTLYGIISRR